MSLRPYAVLLMLALSLPSAVRALGLGDIRIASGLNEPLTAQIDIVGASREELAALTAGVANRDTFQRHGADRPAFLSSATFKVGMDGQGRPVLNIRSGEAFSDPLVTLLVDLRWGKNELVREYSLLLDPPGYDAPLPAGVALATAPVPVALPKATAPIEAAASVSPAAAAATPAAAPALAHLEPPAHLDPPTPIRIGMAPRGNASGDLTPAAHGHREVTANGTLRLVARHVGARTESQMQHLMIAIFRANPTAFDGNINRMHRHAVLRVPTAAELAAIPLADAQHDVRAQMTAWRLDSHPSASAPPAPRIASATASASPAPRTALATAPAPAAAIATVAATPASADPDGSLKIRVESLEHALLDMHQQLAAERAKLQTLKERGVWHPLPPHRPPRHPPNWCACPS